MIIKSNRNKNVPAGILVTGNTMGPTILAITILFAVCVTYNTATVKTYVWAERRPFCGSDLADMIHTMCPRDHEYDYEEEPKGKS